MVAVSIKYLGGRLDYLAIYYFSVDHSLFNWIILNESGALVTFPSPNAICNQ